MGEELLGFCLHVLLAMTGAFLLAPVIVQVVLRLVCLVAGVNLYQIPDIFQRALSPISVLTYVLFGFLLNRYLRHRSAPWIVTIGVVWLGTALLWDFRGFGHSEFIGGHFWRYEFNQLFTSKCVQSECLEQWIVAVPAMAIVWYGIGSWIGLRASESRKPNPEVA
jgi:hypothetical protein